MRLLKLLLILYVCAAGPAAAGPFEDAKAAFDKGDYATAMRLWRPLADQGLASAQRALAFMYAEGRGVPQDYAMAVAWYRKAAEQGDAAGQYYLGVMYDEGLGVPQDYAQSYMWLDLAAANGPKEDRDKAVGTRDSIAAKMTPAQVAEAQKLAREWKPKR